MAETIKSLQYGRACAAIAVVAHHSVAAATAFVPSHLPLAAIPLYRGYLGVDFFFVLSGFIIMHAHANDPKSPTSALVYIKKRLRRIYIPYLPISICLVALYLLLPNVSQGNRDWGLLTSMTLIPTEHPPAIAVAWTLIHEMIFYSLFLVSYFTGNSMQLIVVWLAAILGKWSLGWTSGVPFAEFLLSPLNIEFIVGMGLAQAYPRVPNHMSKLLIYCGLVAVVGYFYFFDAESNRVLFGISLAPIVLGIAVLERQSRWAPIGGWLILGNGSYSIYLVHATVVSIAARLSAAAMLSLQITLPLCILAGVIAGLVYHFGVEKPCTRLVYQMTVTKP